MQHSVPSVQTLPHEVAATASPLPRLLWRPAGLAVLLVLELSVLSVWLDGATLTRKAGLTALMGDWGPVVTRVGVMFAVVFVAFGYIRNRAALEEIWVIIYLPYQNC